MKSRIFITIVAILLISGMSFSETGKITAKLKEYMQHAEKAGFSGSVLVAVKDKVLLEQGYGFSDKGNQTAFTADTVSTTGSVTKQFTGAGILKLQMQGKLYVNDPITKYFKNVPDDKKGITLHHLLTHTAGFPGAIGHDFEPISAKDFVKSALETKLERKPGVLYEYSNVGFSLLGIVIEIVSGQSYETYLNENLFKPAGMENTGYLLPQWEKAKLAHGYRGDKDWGTLLDHPWLDSGPGWHLRGNGGILSTVGDMYKWHIALEGDKVLGPEEKKLLYFPHVKEGEDAESFYGYGWAIFTTRRNTKLVAHNGGNPYFSADFLRYVDEDVVVIVLANTNGYRAWKVSEGLARVVFGYEYNLPQKKEAIVDVPGADKSWGLPDSITGDRSAALLNAIDSQEKKTAREFIEDYYAKNLLEKYTLEEHLSRFLKLQKEIGKIELLGAMKTGEYSVRLKVKSITSGVLFQLTFQLEPDPPHKIISIGVDAQ